MTEYMCYMYHGLMGKSLWWGNFSLKLLGTQIYRTMNLIPVPAILLQYQALNCLTYFILDRVRKGLILL